MEENRPGPSGLSSGLSIHATVALTMETAALLTVPVTPLSDLGSGHGGRRPGNERPREREGRSTCLHLPVAARTTGPPCSCKQKCFDRFTPGERADVVQSFYDLDDKDLQDSHLFGLIRPNAVKRRRPRAGGKTPRLATYTYTVSAHAGVMPECN